MRNEFQLVNDTEKYLRELGCSIVEIGRNRSNSADLISYTIDSNGKKQMAAIAEIKEKFVPELQQRLFMVAKSLNAPYALLVTKDQFGNWNHYWFDVKTSLPLMNEPHFKNKGFLMNRIDMEHQLNKVVEASRQNLYGNWEIALFIADLLLIRSYLHETNAMEKWSQIADDYQQFVLLIKQANKFYNLSHDDDSWIIRISNLELNQIVKNLDVLNPKHHELGKAFLDIVISLTQRGNSIFVTTEHVRSLIRGIVSTLDIKGGKLADLSSGFGTILLDVFSEQTLESIVGFEIHHNVARISQISFIISGLNKVRIESKNSLLLGDEYKELYNLVLVDPPIGLQLDKKEHFYSKQFKITSKNARVSDLMVEQAIRMAQKGAYIVAILPEITLSGSGASKEVRKLIMSETTIEAIISLPVHFLKPWTMAKVSVLVLRKKTSKDEQDSDVFLGKLESVDDITKIVDAFETFKKKEELRG